VFVAFIRSTVEPEPYQFRKPAKDMYAPMEWAGLVKNWPDNAPGTAEYLRVMAEEKQKINASRSAAAGFNTPWLLEGPGNIGGRFNCITKDPVNTAVFYAGSATGGIWKTSDNCQTWNPVFDDFSYLAISDIKVRATNNNVVYAATGDKNISGYMFVGDGVYKSVDGGTNWNNIGLANTGIVSEIILHPQDTDVIFAATMGFPFYKDANRGMYKTTDGGNTWTQVLFINDSTGIIDLVMDPFNPDILYAASWNRLRNNSQSLVAGPDAGVWRSNDGGNTWTLLSGGLPQGNISRIGLAVSGMTPGRLFACYVDDLLDLQGIYKSDDYGGNWTPVDITDIGGGSMGGFGWYFGRIEVNPTDDNELFVCAVDMYKTNNGGNSWSSAWSTSSPHADKHDILWINGQDWMMATDGGLYRSNDDGVSWNDIEDIPNNQFYRITYNPHNTGEYAGGVQDNGTNVGNAANLNSWNKIFGADGFTIRYHPTNPNIIFVEYQNGEILFSDDGGNTFNGATNGIDFSDRRNWDMPYVFNPQDPDEMLTGTYRPYINSTGTNVNWVNAGPDLTDGLIFEPRFHNISAVAWSPVNTNHLLTGTSDGNVWFSANKGVSWVDIKTGLPDRYITSLHFSPITANKIFVSVSGYKDGVNQPHVFRSLNNGTSWTSISGNLPNLAVNDVFIMPGNDDVIFAATDGGVYGTTNGGNDWLRVGSNMPYVPVYDLELEPVNRMLLAGTFGRSMYSVNVDTLLSNVGIADNPVKLNTNVFPTLFTDYVTVDTKLSNSEARLYSMNGRLIRSVSLQSGTNSIALPGIPSGMYLLEVSDGKSNAVWKLVKP
jgi:photosystem II stability/assembly factor-like uncharacterized protein